MYEIKARLLRYKEYHGLHTTGFAGVTFQVSTSHAIICINFLKLDVVEVKNSVYCFRMLNFFKFLSYDKTKY